MTDSSGLAVLPIHRQSELVNLSFTVLVRVAVAVKRHHGHSNTYRGKHLFGAGLHFRVWSIIMVDGNGIMQADMVLEKELRVSHLDKQGT